jgi:hypothetical protein
MLWMRRGIHPVTDAEISEIAGGHSAAVGAIEELSMDWNEFWEGAVQRLRFMRVSCEPRSEIERKARLYERELGFDAARLLAEAEQPGPVDNPLLGVPGEKP